ncbi:hypothetical protein [Methanoregula sp. UBA64]|jgi:hypothetical protein|uniref:hypothetical protein n=1 Tax=Methanoregula sp. UBA64 TaxID=1915554 RepID=UPI0025F38CFA|nr:hypothetical protein [Methanoregula sp. UBA64]
MNHELNVRGDSKEAKPQDIFFKSLSKYLSVVIVGFIIYFISLYVLFFFTESKQVLIDLFNIFENSSHLLCIYYFKIIYLLYHPNFTEIAVFFGFVLAFCFLISSMEKQGHMVFESEDISGKYVQLVLFIVMVFNFVLILPYLFYLIIIVHRPVEAALILILYGMSLLFVQIFSKYTKLMHNYNLLDEFCMEFLNKAASVQNVQNQNRNLMQIRKNVFQQIQNLKSTQPPRELLENAHEIFGEMKNSIEIEKKSNVISSSNARKDVLITFIWLKPFLKTVIFISMFLIIYVSYWLNFNLLSLVYIESIFITWMFIVLSIEFPKGPVKGPNNIFLKSGYIFNRVFIIEESQKGHIMTLHKGNIVRKIMTDSISYIEPSDVDIYQKE